LNVRCECAGMCFDEGNVGGSYLCTLRYGQQTLSLASPFNVTFSLAHPDMY
jgi:hypothetical protein